MDLLLTIARFAILPAGITKLDKRISNLRNLEVLYLGGNDLTEVPVELGTLHNLSLLYLGDNMLQQLPAEIGRLGSLRTLNLHNNKFKYLPQVRTPSLAFALGIFGSAGCNPVCSQPATRSRMSHFSFTDRSFPLLPPHISLP